MNPEYYLLTKSAREGPYSEQDLLDLLDAKQVSPNQQCLQLPSGETRRAGDWFEVIEPEEIEPPLEADEEEDVDEILPEEDEAEDENLAAMKPITHRREVLEEEPDEEARDSVYLVLHPSMVAYWKLFVAAAGLAWLGIHYAESSSTALAGGLGCAALLMLVVVAHRMRYTYVVRRNRVEMIQGWFVKSSSEIRMQDIRAINVTRNGLIAVFGVGDIAFSSSASDGDEVVFRSVGGVTGIKKMVRQLQP